MAVLASHGRVASVRGTVALRVMPADDAPEVRRALAVALRGGPAVFPVSGPVPTDIPLRVPAGTALVVETSGSTARSKRVMLSADALRASAEGVHNEFGGPGVWVLALPAHYIAGAQVLVRSFLSRTPLVVTDVEGFRTATARALEHAGGLPLYVSLVPHQLERLIDTALDALWEYHTVLVGGQAVPTALLARAKDADVSVVATYGASETAGGCVVAGQLLPGVALRIDEGEILVGGPTLATGYLDDPDRTAATFLTEPDGARWYRTGDLGELDEVGELTVRGRKDDVFISGGVKVSLGEVDAAIREVLPDAVAVRVSDPSWGERAAVVLAEAAGPMQDAEVLMRCVNALAAVGLPPAARPVRVLRVPAIPHTASGKVDRLALATLLAQAEQSTTP